MASGTLAGLHVESDFPLVGLAAAGPGRVDVRIRRAEPDEIARRAEMSPSAILLSPPNLGQFLIASNEEILVAPLPAAAPRSIFAFLFGPCFGVIAYRNEILPFHASAIDTGKGCIAFAGASGAGKSTLAAVMGARGYAIYGDDLCFLRRAPAGGLDFFPGVRWLRLTDASSTALGYNNGPLPPSGKYSLPLPPLDRPDAPGRLKAIYILVAEDEPMSLEITRLHGAAAAARVFANAYRTHFAHRLGLSGKFLPLCAAVAQQTPIFLFRRYRDLAFLPQSCDFLLNHFDGLQACDAPL